jgi:radical SAM superfamily enzyme YgiQ (UPF0313 family)
VSIPLSVRTNSTVGAHIHPADIIKDILPKDIEGAHIVFINMPLREAARPTATPEGPLLMATNLRNTYGVKATVIDLNAYRIKDESALKRGLPTGRHLTHQEAFSLITKHIKVHGDPDIVALSGMITTLRWQEEVARMIRRIVPDTFLVSGNGLATELKTGLFTYIPELDAVAHSEGDDVIVKIVYDAISIKKYGLQQALASGKLKPYSIGRLNGRERFIYAGDRPRDLDKLPYADLDIMKTDVDGNPTLDWIVQVPAWSATAGTSSATPWKDEDLVPKTTSVSSRGCPFACEYCYRGAQGERTWGVRSATHIYEEFKHHIDRYGMKFHAFPDDNFAVAVPRIQDMVPLIGPLKIPWGTHTRMDEGADPMRIIPMAKAGCVYIGFGPESANRHTLETIGKGGHTLTMGFERARVDGTVYEFPKSMTMAIRNCLNYGIHANCTWIMGSPKETLARLKDSVAFIRWQELLYELHDIPSGAVNKRMFTLTWYPGTEIINHEKVRQELTRLFKITFRPSPTSKSKWEPVCDEHFHEYLLELDDATKVLEGPEGEPLNFSDMSTSTFRKIRELIDSGNTAEILSL